MKKVLVSFLTVISSFVSTSFADYRGEIETGFLSLDQNIFETEGYALSASVFTKPIVHGGNAPNEEILFVERVGVLGFAYGAVDTTDIHSAFDRESKSYGASYIHRQSGSRHGFEVSWLRKDIDSKSYAFGNLGSDDETTGAGYFYYLDDGFALGVDVTRANHVIFSRLGLPDINNEFWSYGASVRRMFELVNDRWFVFEGGFETMDTEFADDVLLRLEGIYYLSRETGVSLAAKTTDEFEGATIGLGISHYFRENFAVEFLISHNDDSDEYGLGGKLRF